MNWNYPDMDPSENEQEYEDRQNELSKSAVGVMFGTASVFLFILKMAAVFGIFFYAGFLLSQRLLGEETGTSKFWFFSILFTYLIFCFIYFFKGTIIGLRTKNSKLWIIPWAVCVLICCIVPGLIVKSAVAALLGLGQTQNIFYIGLSWAVFIISCLYLYNIYQFKTPAAPKILKWSYALGLKVSSY